MLFRSSVSLNTSSTVLPLLSGFLPFTFSCALVILSLQHIFPAPWNLVPYFVYILTEAVTLPVSTCSF